FLDEEISHFLQAAPYERTGERQGYRNGYKPRQLTTRGGVGWNWPCPRIGKGGSTASYSPAISARRGRCYWPCSSRICRGCRPARSRRSPKRCGTHFSKSLVSRVCQQLDPEIQAWLQRPLTQPYPYLMVHARYEQVREKHRVVSKGWVLVQGFGQDGHRDLLTVAIAPTESQASWGQLFSGLIDRGLTGVQLVTSDEHKGLVQAIRRYFDQAAWQYCQVHFQRTVLAEVPKTHRTQEASQLRGFLQAVDRPQADRLFDTLVHSYDSSYPSLVHKLETHREALLACMEWAEEWTTGKRHLDLELLNQ
ncbi:MAG: transposase, partial [Candidatus Handelsmanbacteria bacterium]|nr:transposase [Candidatus Handelsmanbacteria bacterium]